MDQKMIRGVARKVYRQYVAGTEHEARLEQEDLMHAGVLGYLEAGRKLQQEKYPDTGPYYYQHVQGRMIDLIRRQALVRMPQQPYGRLKELLAAKKDLKNRGGTVDEKQLAAKLGWSVGEVNTLLASVPRVFSVDRARRGDEDDDSDFFDTLLTSAQKKAPQLDGALKKEIAGLIQLCLERLESPRLRLILAARYLEDIRLKVLAEKFACTLQAVHYQEKKALHQMRGCLEKNGWQWDDSEEQL